MKKKKLGIDVFKFKKHPMIPFDKRNLLQSFNDGDQIFVSFDGKVADRGFVQKVYDDEKRINVLLHTGSSHFLHFDEVHVTPEMAVKYQVTL